ncbi:MAG TPA: site-specific DNA-methyltransferase [Thermoplasmata archaeon]|nr:site-specific DNA-methyltransferase [Thermoplasmata archaeon]
MPRLPIEVLAGDARSIPGLADGSVHLVVTSPPYPKIPQWDALFAALGATTYPAMHRVLEDAYRECFRVLVDGGLLALNIGDAVRSDAEGFRLWPNHVTATEAAERTGFRPLPYVLWKKPMNKPNAFLGSGFLPPNAYVTLDCEFVLLFRKGGVRRFRPHDPVRAASRYDRSERDAWFSQLWEGIRGVRQGPGTARTGAFPPEIPERLIRMFSCVGETVLDPFAGTGTTLWAAHRLGRRAIGVEIDPARAEALRRRAERTDAGPTRRREAVPGGRAPRRPRA